MTLAGYHTEGSSLWIALLNRKAASAVATLLLHTDAEIDIVWGWGGGVWRKLFESWGLVKWNRAAQVFPVMRASSYFMGHPFEPGEQLIAHSRQASSPRKKTQYWEIPLLQTYRIKGPLSLELTHLLSRTTAPLPPKRLLPPNPLSSSARSQPLTFPFFF